MSDNEDEYDDLPSISVNSSACDLSVLSMPPAAELASQRAREEETERELLLLRSHQEENSNSLPMRLAHSDSSSSEGEASLAAAVTALQMQGSGSGSEGAAAGSTAGSQGAGAAPDAAELLAALLPRLDHRDEFIADYLHAIKHADSDAATQLTDQVVESVSSAVVGGCASWRSAEVVSVAAWLCCACVWRAPAVRRGRVRRALHRLLLLAPHALDARALAAALAAAAPPLARLHMSDAARTAAAGPGDALADLLLTSVLTDLCKLDGEGEGEGEGEGDGSCRWAAVSAGVSRSWARLDASARYLVVSACGRALAAAPPASAHRRRLLAALAGTSPATTAATASTGDRRHPDHLKVLVGTSKLQLLFRADK